MVRVLRFLTFAYMSQIKQYTYCFIYLTVLHSSEMMLRKGIRTIQALGRQGAGGRGWGLWAGTGWQLAQTPTSSSTLLPPQQPLHPIRFIAVYDDHSARLMIKWSEDPSLFPPSFPLLHPWSPPWEQHIVLNSTDLKRKKHVRSRIEARALVYLIKNVIFKRWEDNRLEMMDKAVPTATPSLSLSLVISWYSWWSDGTAGDEEVSG